MVNNGSESFSMSEVKSNPGLQLFLINLKEVVLKNSEEALSQGGSLCVVNVNDFRENSIRSP